MKYSFGIFFILRFKLLSVSVVKLILDLVNSLWLTEKVRQTLVVQVHKNSCKVPNLSHDLSAWQRTARSLKRKIKWNLQYCKRILRLLSQIRNFCDSMEGERICFDFYIIFCWWWIVFNFNLNANWPKWN